MAEHEEIIARSQLDATREVRLLADQQLVFVSLVDGSTTVFGSEAVRRLLFFLLYGDSDELPEALRQWQAAQPAVEAYNQAHPFVEDSDELRGEAMKIASAAAAAHFCAEVEVACFAKRQDNGAYDILVVIDSTRPEVNYVWRVKDGEAHIAAAASEQELLRATGKLDEPPTWRQPGKIF